MMLTQVRCFGTITIKETANRDRRLNIGHKDAARWRTAIAKQPVSSTGETLHDRQYTTYLGDSFTKKPRNEFNRERQIEKVVRIANARLHRSNG